MKKFYFALIFLSTAYSFAANDTKSLDGFNHYSCLHDSFSTVTRRATHYGYIRKQPLNIKQLLGNKPVPSQLEFEKLFYCIHAKDAPFDRSMIIPGRNQHVILCNGDRQFLLIQNQLGSLIIPLEPTSIVSESH